MGSRSSRPVDKEILAQQQEEEEEEAAPEQYVVPRGKFPMGIGPYAGLGKPRKTRVKKIKSKTPKPEAETIAELLMSDSEEEEEEEEGKQENTKYAFDDIDVNVTTYKTGAETDRSSIRGKSRMTESSLTVSATRPNQTPAGTPMTAINDSDDEDDDEDSDIEFGSQFSELNKPHKGPGVLFVRPDTNMPAKQTVGQGSYEYGQFPMSFSPVQSEVDLHAATIVSEIRDTMEYLPGEDHTDTGLNAYFEAHMTKDNEDDRSFISDTEEEEDTSWMEDGRTNKQMG
ncbi:uncharacterized protein LOC110466658 [Mizuhopecten yessoensis]|uniref:uncharacterized protein LOC110466658 n=1 Tax=Mizuhopecten yessoensis TaxID=6573 RepID=UPI000B45DABA|nr:uncharacterized protein LOC110466658 [Mizuhopecten yessoensis]XP_021378989.1 uncharacterized protein LOC110466658 [Mizuhopecten yessoensis]